jgi:hypothetical protein
VLAVITVVMLLAGLLLPHARRRAQLAGSVQNLKQIGAAAFSYSGDFSGHVFSLSWTPGAHECDEIVFPDSVLYNDAAADQAVCILRHRAGRTDIKSIRGWHPHIFYNTLVLVDYLNDGLPSQSVVSPADAPRLSWQRAVRDNPDHPAGAYLALLARPFGTSIADTRWAYSSSYEMQPSFYSPDARRNAAGSPIIDTVYQLNSHRFFNVGGSQTVLGNRMFSQVRHPSNKAFMYETVQRFFGDRYSYFMETEARVPVLHADGSALVRSTERANAGFQPNSPFGFHTTVNYQPELTWEPAALYGNPSSLRGVFRWTRSGLRGRDFMGPEVPWTE